MKLNDIRHPWRYCALEAPGSGEVTPPPVIAPVETLADAADEPVAAETPKTFSVSDDDLQKSISAGIQQTVLELQREQLAAQARQFGPPAVYDPEVAAVSAVRAIRMMEDEALDLYPDATPEQRARIRQELEPFITTDQANAARTAKLHLKLARAAMAEAIDKGEYVPSRYRSKEAPKPAPLPASATPAATDRLPQGLKSEIEELQTKLGVTFTKDEIAAYTGGHHFA